MGLRKTSACALAAALLVLASSASAATAPQPVVASATADDDQLVGGLSIGALVGLLFGGIAISVAAVSLSRSA